MVMPPKLLTLSSLVENLTENKLMLFSLPITLSSLHAEPSRLDLPINKSLLTSLKHVKLMELNQFKVFFPTKPRNIWSMEMRQSLTKNIKNKELKTGNSLQVMLLLLMFSPLPEMVWEENPKPELWSTKEKWTYNIPLNPSTLELSSLLSTKSTQLSHSLSEDSKT